MHSILEVNDLHTHFFTDKGIVKAVDGVSFSLKKGESIGIVGESGSGKSVTNLSILNLIQSPPGKIVKGEIIYNNEDLLKVREKRLREIRGSKIAMVFQDPMSSLNPFLRISTQMTEVIRLHNKVSKEEALYKAVSMLDIVGIPSAEEKIYCYPHQFSGGMCQRVMIAMALSCNPDILILDEPTSALDVTIQAQILDLLIDLKKKMGMSIILITHSLPVASQICDTVLVMYAGKIIERGTCNDIFQNPKHPYTKNLINSIPVLI